MRWWKYIYQHDMSRHSSECFYCWSPMLWFVVIVVVIAALSIRGC